MGPLFRKKLLDGLSPSAVCRLVRGASGEPRPELSQPWKLNKVCLLHSLDEGPPRRRHFRAGSEKSRRQRILNEMVV